MWNGRSGLGRGCVLAVWLTAALPESHLQAALFFVQPAGGAKSLSTTESAQGRPTAPTAKVNPWQKDRMDFKGREGVADAVSPIPSPTQSELIESLRSVPSKMEDRAFLGSHTLEPKRRSEFATELSSMGIVASCPKDASLVPSTMSREIFEEYFRTHYLRTSRKISRASLVRSVEYKGGASKVVEKGRSRGLR